MSFNPRTVNLTYRPILFFLKIGIKIFTGIDHKYIPEYLWILMERCLLYMGAYIALVSTLKLPARGKIHTYSIHTLLQHEDVHRYIIGIYSLLRFLHEYPAIVIYDDGSLTPSDIRLLHTFSYVSVVSSQESNTQFRKFYNNNLTLEKYRNTAIRTRKIIDLAFLKQGIHKILLLDSDVGFFRYPSEIFNYINSSNTFPEMLYMRDIQDAYATDTKNLKKIYNVEVARKLNCGILCVNSRIVTKQFVEKTFAMLEKNENKYEYIPYWVDQTPWALLAAKGTSARLSSSYYLGMGETPTGRTCRHYVHGSRFYFIKDLLLFCN
jgi:hypothetical protein